MNVFHRQPIDLVLAAVLLVTIGCDKSSTKTTSVAPIPALPAPGTPASEADKPGTSAVRVLGSKTIEGNNVVALEIVDESKFSTMSDQPTPEELASWAEVELPRLELLSIRIAKQTGEVVPLNDGKRYLIASEFPELWDASSQKPIRIYQDESWGAGNAISSMAVSYDNRWFAATDKEGVLRIWEIESGAVIAKKMISKTKYLGVAISPDANELLLTIEDQIACVLDAKTLEQTKELGKAQSGITKPYYIGSQFGVLVGQRVQIHDLLSNTPVAEFPTQLPFQSSMVSADRIYFGDRSAYGSWDAATRTQNRHWDGQSVEIIAKVGNGLAWTYARGALTLVELESGKILQYIESSPSEKAFVPSIAGLSWLTESKVLVVASSNGLVRVWGTKESGDKLGLKPIAPAMASSSTPSSFPPKLSQLREIIEMRQLPRLPRKGYENINDQFNQHYRTSESIPKCKRFYRHILGAHGWKEESSADSLSNELGFAKNDYSLVVRLKKIDEDTTEILIGMTGFVDLRELPRPESIAIELLDAKRNSLTFKTRATRLEIESQLLRLFASKGWSFVTRSDVSGIQRYSDNAALSFIRNGISLVAYISPYNASPNERQVRFIASPKTFWSPIPPGCDCIDGRGLLETSLALPDVLATYDQLLADDGWTKLDSHSRPDGHETRYFRGQLDLLLHFQPTSHQTILVKQDSHRDDYFPWINHSIEAAAFPLIEPIDGVNFNRSEQWIEYSTRASLAKIREAYSGHFAAKGLTEEYYPRDDGTFSQRFLNVKHTAVLTIIFRPEQDVNVVRINGSAIEWKAALPSDPPQLMSFEEWMRCKAYRPSLRHLDEYVREMSNLQVPNR